VIAIMMAIAAYQQMVPAQVWAVNLRDVRQCRAMTVMIATLVLIPMPLIRPATELIMIVTVRLMKDVSPT
jgi:hypothetical protein